MNKIFDEIEDLVLYYATDDYDYKKSVALFNVGKIEKMVDYCRYLQHQLEEKEQENQQLQKQKDELETSYDILQKNNTTLAKQKEEAYKIADDYYKENQQLKKQKDDVVELIKARIKENEGHINARIEIYHYKNMLRMLGEIE